MYMISKLHIKWIFKTSSKLKTLHKPTTHLSLNLMQITSKIMPLNQETIIFFLINFWGHSYQPNTQKHDLIPKVFYIFIITTLLHICDDIFYNNSMHSSYWVQKKTFTDDRSGINIRPWYSSLFIFCQCWIQWIC